ncbi:hypothetical protein [Nitrobacter winogradskyi]|uniref:hypothetical protein n=1 Tax=Nitrobacter winogradskyi TaxID=913 RepID=UPI0015E84B0F|nr:hypothetical protein [Nitrobacter winogradskyi]
MAEPTDRLQRLLEYVVAEGRICPQPQRWNLLWSKLPNREQHNGSWVLSPPLILAAWHYSSDDDKQERLRDHILWAERFGELDMVDQFLRSLGDLDWYRG